MDANGDVSCYTGSVPRMTLMNIRSPRVDALAHRLARLTGEDIETALERALEDRLSCLSTPPAVDRHAALRALLEPANTMPVRDGREPDAIIGYGPDGLPG